MLCLNLTPHIHGQWIDNATVGEFGECRLA